MASQRFRILSSHLFAFKDKKQRSLQSLLAQWEALSVSAIFLFLFSFLSFRPLTALADSYFSDFTFYFPVSLIWLLLLASHCSNSWLQFSLKARALSLISYNCCQLAGWIWEGMRHLRSLHWCCFVSLHIAFQLECVSICLLFFSLFVIYSASHDRRKHILLVNSCCSLLMLIFHEDHSSSLSMFACCPIFLCA